MFGLQEGEQTTKSAEKLDSNLFPKHMSQVLGKDMLNGDTEVICSCQQKRTSNQ